MLSSRPLSLLPALLALSLSASAHAGEPGPQDEAERLGKEGQAALAARDFATAIDRFSRAEALGSLPHLLGLARAQAGLGQVLLAQQTYERVLRTGSAAGAPSTQALLADARRELDQLVAQIPTLTIDLGGAPVAELSLDGAPLPLTAVGQKLPVSPGKHLVRARSAGGAAASVTVTVDTGKHETLSLELSPGTPAPPPASPPAAPPSPPLAPPPGPRAVVSPPLPSAAGPISADPGAGQRKVAYVTFGVGGAGLLVGAITAVVAANKHSELAALCPGDRCPASAVPQIDSYHAVGTASTVTFLGGGMFAAAGAILLLTAPKAGETAKPGASVSVGPGSLGITGRF
ncbi:MAG: hypothetical protein U0359_29240 [Byssovorax sp.]